MHTKLNLKHFHLFKKSKENVRYYALNVEALVKQGWYNEALLTIHLYCNEIFTRGPPEIYKDFAENRQVTHISSSSRLKFSFFFILLSLWLTLKIILLKKLKRQELSLEIDTFPDTFQQNASIEKTPPNLHNCRL